MSSGNTSHDMVVIGAGPGGYAAAIHAARAGLDCAVVEVEASPGGVCLHWGCIPTKALLRAAEVYGLVQRAGEYGVQVEGARADWDRVMARSRQVPEELAAGVTALLRRNGVTVYRGRGRLTPTRQVEVCGPGGEVQAILSAARVLLATGGRPRSLPGVEIDGDRVWSSRDALEAAACPDSLAVVGAGPVGVEFACIFAAFGSRVTLIEAADQVLPHEDGEIARVLRAALEEQGIQVCVGAEVKGLVVDEQSGVRLTVAGEQGAADREVSAERALMATGVTGNTDGLGLEGLGIRTRNGAVKVDEDFQTSARGVYAVGDLIGPPQLAHAAAAEARLAAESLLGHATAPLVRSRVPRCVYSRPQVASVGLTEAQARQRVGDIRVGRFPFAASGLARAVGEGAGLVKLVFGARYGDLLGAAIVGPEATELIAELGLALALEATYEELADTVHAHPTLSEAVMEAAAAAFGRAVHI